MNRFPDHMHAIAIREPGGPGVLELVECPLPLPDAHEVLIRVAAAGVNRPDVLQRRGLYPPPPDASPLPGLEVAGEVVALGSAVTRFRCGDRVCALTAGGGYAEYAVAHEGSVLPVPAGVSLIEAAAIPETFFTVWANVFERGRLQAGETVLVHGGTSGIGSTSILLAKAFGARVLATAGSDAKCAAALGLGADAAINHRSQDFVAETLRLTGGHGADVIVDLIAGDYVARNYAAAAVDGRIVQIGILHGPAREVDFMPLLVKRLTHTGSTLRARSKADKAAIAQALEEKVWPLLASGQIRVPVWRHLDLADAAAAHAEMEAGEHVGKLVLVSSWQPDRHPPAGFSER